MFNFVSVIYVLVCVFLILVVLLQQGKGGGMGSAFGGSTQTVFGGAGAGNFLTRLTAVAATLFMVLSAVLAYMSSSGDRVLEVAEEIEAARREPTVGAEGGETSEPPSRDTLEDAQNDEVLNALEEAARQQAEPTSDDAAEPPLDEEPVAEEPGAEAAEPQEATEEVTAPSAASRPARPARPRPATPAEETPQRPAPAADGE